MGTRLKPATISPCTITMDHDATICFMIDRLARGPDQDVHVRSVGSPKYPSRSAEAIYLKSSIGGVGYDITRPLLRFLRRRARRAQHRAPRPSRDPTISSIRGPIPGPASTSDATAQMDHNAVVYTRSTDLPVLRWRRCVRGALERPQTREL